MNTEPVSYVTASDLADMMQEYGESGFQYPLCMELKYVAVMLRQQQAEIEALKLRVERMIENQSHHEGIAHAGGFEAGYQAAKAKTLTDEEILKMAADKFHYSEYKLVIDFARAILRKAQEK
jgi:hypothetical protein